MKCKILIVFILIAIPFAIPSSMIMNLFRQEAVAVSPRTYDGGTTKGVEEVCTCSGGILAEYESIIDRKSYYFVYQLGVTEEYENYNSLSSDNYFLDTHLPVGICLIYVYYDCEESNTTPDGTLMTIGTS